MPESDIDLLTRAAEDAGDIALKYFRSDPKKWDKGDGAGPVTEADLAVDAMLKDRLMAARAGFGWLSEETEDNADRLGKKQVFIIDPIDGTRSFIAGEKTWAHALAMVEDGRPTAAVVYLPAQEKMYLATTDFARLNGRDIRASGQETVEGADILAHKSFEESRNWRQNVPGFRRHFRPSLAYHMTLVAEGRFDAMVTLRDAWEWDIVAGTLIAEVAGATVSDRHQKRLLFNSRRGKLDGVVVANPRLHGDLKSRLR